MCDIANCVCVVANNVELYSPLEKLVTLVKLTHLN